MPASQQSNFDQLQLKVDLKHVAIAVQLSPFLKQAQHFLKNSHINRHDIHLLKNVQKSAKQFGLQQPLKNLQIPPRQRWIPQHYLQPSVLHSLSKQEPLSLALTVEQNLVQQAQPLPAAFPAFSKIFWRSPLFHIQKITRGQTTNTVIDLHRFKQILSPVFHRPQQ